MKKAIAATTLLILGTLSLDCGGGSGVSGYTVKCIDTFGKIVVNEPHATAAYNSQGGFLYYDSENKIHKMNGYLCSATEN